MSISELSDKVERVSSGYVNHNNITRDHDWFVFKLQEELGELTQQYLMMTDRARKKGLSDEEIKNNFTEEVADVFAHVLLLTKHFDIDIEKAVQEKWLKYLKE